MPELRGAALQAAVKRAADAIRADIVVSRDTLRDLILAIADQNCAGADVAAGGYPELLIEGTLVVAINRDQGGADGERHEEEEVLRMLRTEAALVSFSAPKPRAAPERTVQGPYFVDGIGWVVPCSQAVAYTKKLLHAVDALREGL